jgi:hypothetical protein
VLWFSCLVAFLVGARFSTVGRTRTSAEIFLFTFPLSGLGTVMMVPAVPMIGEDSVFQNGLLIALLIMWTAFSLLCTPSTYISGCSLPTSRMLARSSAGGRADQALRELRWIFGDYYRNPSGLTHRAGAR